MRPTSRRRFTLGIGLAMIMTAVLVTPALGAKPSKMVISLDVAADEAAFTRLLTKECRVPIVADFEGTVTVHVFTDREGNFVREIDKYQIRDTFTNTETGEVVEIHDVGPDIFFFNKQGEFMLALTGRAVTGSGVIGRTLVNLDTGEVIRMSGKVLGDAIANICAALG